MLNEEFAYILEILQTILKYSVAIFLGVGAILVIVGNTVAKPAFDKTSKKL
jgi:hypothetical protein